MNDNRLRFCSKCGNALVLTPSGTSRIAPKRLTWWERRFGSQQRADRRAYRRSLPAFYRWRPVVVGAVVLSLATMAGTAIYTRAKTDKDNPLTDAWYSFNQDAVALTGVRATVLGSPLARGTSAGSLTDGNFVATTMVWQTPSEGACTVPPSIELQWKDLTRVRWISIRPGLPYFDPTRTKQFRPKTLEVSTGNPHRCVRLELTDDEERQEFAVDTKDPLLVDPPTLGRVDTVRIAVLDAYPPDPANSPPLMSITEIRLFRMRDAKDGPPPKT